MKNFKTLLLAATLVFAVSSCKKDYPRDIPRWLKNKIKSLNKESKGTNCENDECRYIDEYTDGENILFFYRPVPEGTPAAFFVFDYDGNEICFYETLMSSECQFYDLNNFYFKRNIWTED